MRVVIAPDSFGGTLSARAAGAAMTDGWLSVRPDDDLVTLALSDGGEGLIDVLVDGDVRELEVVGPRGTPVTARWRLLGGGTALIETAEACGLRHVPADDRDPLGATTYGVGQLLDAARGAGAKRIVVGLGGSATVDAGAGALTALGVLLRRADGSGLKVGGRYLDELDALDAGGLDPGWGEVAIEFWADVTTVLDDAAARFGPQKGATPEAVEHLSAGLARFAEVAERDLGADPGLRGVPGSGAAGGLGYGLATVLGSTWHPGATRVADLVDLDSRLAGADLVVTGEGRLDATSGDGKVLAELHDRATRLGVRVAAVAGMVLEAPEWLEAAIASAPGGPGEDPAAEVAAATARLASELGS